MAFFDFFSLLLAAAFLILGCRPQHLRDLTRYRKALTLFLWSIVLLYALSSIRGLLGCDTHPLGMILSVLSFRYLCLALISPAAAPEPPSSDD